MSSLGVLTLNQSGASWSRALDIAILRAGHFACKENIFEPTFEGAGALARSSAGPLSPHLPAFVASLIEQRYAVVGVRAKAWSAVAFDAWLSAHGVELVDVTEAHIDRFHRRAIGHAATVESSRGSTSRRRCATCCVICAQGLCAATAKSTVPADELVTNFEQFLLRERGLDASTVRGSRVTVRAFLVRRFGDQNVDLRVIAAGDVQDSVEQHARRLRPRALKLSTTGLRMSEALSLHVADVDVERAILTIRGAKLGRVQLVPLHAFTVEVLVDYLRRRNECYGAMSSYLFVSNRGNRLDQAPLHRTFYALSHRVSLRGVTASRGPRLHDFRHRFALHVLTRCYEAGEDAARRLPVLSAYLGHVNAADTYILRSECMAGADGPCDGALGAALGSIVVMARASFAGLLERFFTERLMRQRQASAHTIASYRDTFNMLLQFVQKRLHKAPSALSLEDVDAPLVSAFLDDLEATRGITARTRNLRLTAIHSFFRFASFEAPSHAAQIARVLAVPAKKFSRNLVPFLSRSEVDALLAAPDQRTWFGRRDNALMLLAVQTGLRLSELISLRADDIHLGTDAHVRVMGKGRKERCTPLSKNTRAVLTAWMQEPARAQGQPLFPNARDGGLIGHGVHYLLSKHVEVTNTTRTSLKSKHVSPHVLRHTTAMDLLQAGVEQSVIALWLGHESIETTQINLEANLALKEQMLAKTTPPCGKPGRYRPDDKFLSCLRSL